MSALVPNRFCCDFELPIRYCKEDSATILKGDAWSERYRLPDLCLLEGKQPFSPVYSSWNEQGLYLAVRVTGKKRPLNCDPKRFWKSDHLRLCVDTRSSRTIRRATKYCQQFYFLPAGGGAKRDRPAGGAHKIQRAREDAPTIPSGRIQIVAKTSKTGYSMTTQIPADCLNGFDPVEHPRIGFYYMLEDKELGQQYLTVGDDLNWYVDPSTWATAELVK